jgi:uncharacterized protein (DUF2252 family)
MADFAERLGLADPEERRLRMVGSLVDAFADLIAADPGAFRTKVRKMAADPFAFFRGSDCVFYADVASLEDPWADERTSRVWIHGDLHAANFGTYMDGQGILIFDVNDFDEAHVGHFTWDVQRFAASIALMGWQKALSDRDIDALVERYARAYVDQVRWFVDQAEDKSYSLRLDTTDGLVHDVLQQARLRTRVTLLESLTETEGYTRRFRDGPGVRRLEDDERAMVNSAFEAYLDTIPETKRFRGITYDVKDIRGAQRFRHRQRRPARVQRAHRGVQPGVGQRCCALDEAGQRGRTEQGRDRPSDRVVFPSPRAPHRAVAAGVQAHADPLLGYTEVDGVGYVVSELSPYEADLDWSELTEPAEIGPVLDYLGRATAKVHCVAAEDSDQTLVPFQTEEAIAGAIGDHEDDFTAWLTHFARAYAAVFRDDHRLFVDAFRNGQIPGITSTA